jgi:hypothetical protein
MQNPRTRLVTSSDERSVLDALAASLSRDPQLTFASGPLLALADRVLTVEGEVADVRTKKLTLERLAASRAVGLIDDRLRVVPAERMGDAAIRDHLVPMILGDSSFDECAIDVLEDGRLERLREARAIGQPKGNMRIAVSGGVVTLDGTVPSRNHARLASALAWWVPGTRDVKDFLGARVPEEFDELDLVEGIRIVLEKDPLVDAGQIRVSAHDTSITLDGTVSCALERSAAERDAWFVPDVGEVVNRLQLLH